jgi:hypothetical protein
MSFVESRLTMIFPRYAIYKDQLAGGIGGEFVQGELKPVVATMLDGSARLALEVDRTADGVAAVYFPSAPDSWSGTVAFVPADRVTPLTADFGEVMATFEKLGRNSLGVAGVSRSLFAAMDAGSDGVPASTMVSGDPATSPGDNRPDPHAD